MSAVMPPTLPSITATLDDLAAGRINVNEARLVFEKHLDIARAGVLVQQLDVFAAAALQGLCAGGRPLRELAIESYEIAADMLAERDLLMQERVE